MFGLVRTLISREWLDLFVTEKNSRITILSTETLITNIHQRKIIFYSIKKYVGTGYAVNWNHSQALSLCVYVLLNHGLIDIVPTTMYSGRFNLFRTYFRRAFHLNTFTTTSLNTPENVFYWHIHFTRVFK